MYQDPSGHSICKTQRDRYKKYRAECIENGMKEAKATAYYYMRKNLGLRVKSGYNASGVGKGKDSWRSYEGGSYSQTMQDKVSNWSQCEAEKLVAISKRQRDKFNTASVVFDESTGNYYFGRNNGIGINNSQKNIILFGDDSTAGILPKHSFNKYAVGNCAEVDAVNHALNNGSELSNLYLSTIHTTDIKFGNLKTACENCTYTFKGKVIDNYAGWYEGVIE